MMHIRDRVKELRRVKASELAPNPRNWRTHPHRQQDALRGILAEVGYADALLARELPDGRLEIIDGHLRAETTPDALVPVLVLDVTEEEAVKILVTHDPLAALAEVDLEPLSELLAEVEFESPALLEMVESLSREEESDAEFDGPSDRPEVAIPESYQVVVECENAAEQEELYERMRGEGYKCRVLTL